MTVILFAQKYIGSFSKLAGATTDTVTEKVWGEYVNNQNKKKHGLKSSKSLLFSFSRPNGFAQTTMAVLRLAKNRLFLSESECHTLCTITTI